MAVPSSSSSIFFFFKQTFVWREEIGQNTPRGCNIPQRISKLSSLGLRGILREAIFTREGSVRCKGKHLGLESELPLDAGFGQVPSQAETFSSFKWRF